MIGTSFYIHIDTIAMRSRTVCSARPDSQGMAFLHILPSWPAIVIRLFFSAYPSAGRIS